MLRLLTFGGLKVEGGAIGNGAASPRTRLALLAVLAATGEKSPRREKLMVMFWPDSDDEHARNALRQALFALRRDLGAPELTIGTTDLRLNPDVITSDVGDFDRAIRESRWEDAVACYQGPFLDGFSIREAAEVERWIDEQRQLLAHAYMKALEALAVAATTRGERQEAASWWERRATEDRLSARVALAYMQALVMAGERERAIQYAATHCEAIRSELESDADPEVMALANALRNATGGRGATAFNAPALSSGTSTPTSKSTTVERHVPGRAPETFGLVSAPRRHGRLVQVGALLVVSGLSGLLLARAWRLERLDNAALDARRVVVADFENLTGDTAYDRLGAALADWVTQGVMQTGVARVVDPSSLAAVRQLNPEVNALAGRERVVAMARAAAANTVVAGAIYRQGDSLVIRARITDLLHDRILSTLDPILVSTTDPLQRADLLRDKVAGALASSFDAQVISIMLPSSRPPTFAAYRAYLAGLEEFRQDEEGAIPHFEQASQLDTTFALPLIWSAFAWGNGEHPRERDSVVGVLARRRAFLGPLEELQLQEFQARDKDEELLLQERGARLSPGSTWSMSAGTGMHDRNRMREAIRYFEEVDPEHGWVRDWPTYWFYYSRALHALGEYEKELVVARRYLSLNPTGIAGRVLEVRALLSTGRLDEARRRFDALRTQPDRGCAVGRDMFQGIAQEYFAHGHTADADTVIARWVWRCRDEASRQPFPPSTPDSMPNFVWRQLSLGQALYRAGAFADAVPVLTWVARQTSWEASDAHDYLARIAARRGDGDAAERELRARGVASRAAPGNVEARAAVATLLGHRDRAVELLMDGHRNLQYQALHRDADFAGLKHHAGFIGLTTPK